jgi:hypothetical protein
MEYQRKLSEYSIEELDKELIVRGAQILYQGWFKFGHSKETPERDDIVGQLKEIYDQAKSEFPNEDLRYISTTKLVNTLISKTANIEIPGVLGRWGNDDRKDFYEIEDEKIKENTNCVAAICKKNHLLEKQRGFSALKVKNFGKALNLCDSEPFRQQPVYAGSLCTGFLVKEDVIDTAGHCVHEKDVTDLRIVFGYKMLDLSTPVTQVPNENIYKGVEIIHKVHKGTDKEADWALVKLDRKVEGQVAAALSKEDIYRDQPVYAIGQPLGLPLKAALGAYVCDINESCFVTDLDIYSGNSGSPVFDNDTHKVVGVVVRGDYRDFRWTGKGWRSIIYPNFDMYHKGRGAHCTRVSEFIDIVDQL